LFCTVLWGCAAAFVSGASINPGTLQALSCLVQAPILFAIARPRRATIAATPWAAVLRIGACSAVICACYFFSLRLAPPALASALHLTAPVILLSVALTRGRRAPSAATMAVMVLLAGGLVASVAGTGLSGAGGARTLLGMALGSAGVIACSVTMMNRHGGRGSSTLNAAVATPVSGLPFMPFLVLAPRIAPHAWHQHRAERGDRHRRGGMGGAGRRPAGADAAGRGPGRRPGGATRGTHPRGRRSHRAAAGWSAPPRRRAWPSRPPAGVTRDRGQGEPARDAAGAGAHTGAPDRPRLSRRAAARPTPASTLTSRQDLGCARPVGDPRGKQSGVRKWVPR
jgi:hypothetical protein